MLDYIIYVPMYIKHCLCYSYYSVCSLGDEHFSHTILKHGGGGGKICTQGGNAQFYSDGEEGVKKSSHSMLKVAVVMEEEEDVKQWCHPSSTFPL